MRAIASQITSLTIVYSTVYSDADQRKHQSSVSLAFVRGIHRRPVNSTHKWPVTWKIFPFDDVIMHSKTDCNLYSSRSVKREDHTILVSSIRSSYLTCSLGIPWFTRYTKPIVRKASQIFLATSCRSPVDPWDTHGERSTIGMGPEWAMLMLVNGCTRVCWAINLP